MRPLTKLQSVCLVLITVISACSQRVRVENTPFPKAQTPPLNSMGLVESLATGTVVALTEMAQAPIGTRIPNATATPTLTARKTAQTTTDFTSTPEAITENPGSLTPVLMIILPDGTQHTFTYSSLLEIQTHTVDIVDKPRPAVYLRDLLDQAGWQTQTSFSITLEGNTSMTLLIDRLPEDAALWLDDGHVNFMSNEIPTKDSISDVVLIVLH